MIRYRVELIVCHIDGTWSIVSMETDKDPFFTHPITLVDIAAEQGLIDPNTCTFADLYFDEVIEDDEDTPDDVEPVASSSQED